MSGVDEVRERLLKQFRDLVLERLKKINDSLMSLEGGPDPDASKLSLRELHSLKGEARMMGFPEVNAIVHEMEELVRTNQQAGKELPGASTDALLVAADAVAVLCGSVESSGPPPEIDKIVTWLKQRTAEEVGTKPGHSAAVPAGTATAAATANVIAAAAQVPSALPPAPSARAPIPHPVSLEPVEQTGSHKSVSGSVSGLSEGKGKGIDTKLTDSVRLSLTTLETVTSHAGSLLQISRRRELQAQSRQKLVREMAALSRVAEDLGPIAAEISVRLNRAKELASSLHRDEKLIANEEARDLGALSDEITNLRMLPLSVLFEAYPRMVRDLSRELSKEVELVVSGSDTKADRAVVEALRDPLLHLARNAMDHGLEKREVRLAAKKSPKGMLRFRTSREGDRIVLSVEDDGAGLDPKALREAAVKKGLLQEHEANALSDTEAQELIFVPGFSSRDEVTDLSGRGVGMDVVRTRLQALGGEVVLHSKKGVGTTVELRVPVSLTVAPLLFVEAGEEKLGVAASHIRQALKVETPLIREVAGRPALEVMDEVLPFASIASILGMAPERAAKEGELVLVITAQGQTAALSVDRVLEERVQAILPLRGMLGRFQHLSGATPLADGALAMVLSPSHLIATARGSQTMRMGTLAARAVSQKKRRILVVDDSPLTRELISSLLEAMGYEIVNANDGVDAFARLGKEVVDMVVTDLEMPRMDGLELTRRLKGHPTLRALPVVIVTTRGGDTDRQRGMEAGADGYVAKGDLVRQDLVDIVARLLG